MNVMQVTAHQLLLCIAALEAMAENPNVYPPGTIVHRAQCSRLALAMSAEGNRLLEAEKAIPDFETKFAEADPLLLEILCGDTTTRPAGDNP